MVFDTLGNYRLYEQLSPDIGAALRYLFETDLTAREPYKEKLSDTVGLTYSFYNTVTPESRRWSAHDRVTEVQYVAWGEEKLGFAPRSGMNYESAAEGKDILYFSGEGNWLKFSKGYFVIIFPDDVHIPKISLESSPSAVKKAVFKITTADIQNK